MAITALEFWQQAEKARALMRLTANPSDRPELGKGQTKDAGHYVEINQGPAPSAVVAEPPHAGALVGVGYDHHRSRLGGLVANALGARRHRLPGWQGVQ